MNPDNNKYCMVSVSFPHGNGICQYIIPDELVTEEVSERFVRHENEEYTEEEIEDFDEGNDDNHEFNEVTWMKKPGVLCLQNNDKGYSDLPPNCVITRSYRFTVC